MKLMAVAVDYDGTIARHDALDASVREALAKLRGRGVVVLLVTGRILDDLRRAAGDLHFVDAVVAENGAVVQFPASGHSTSLAGPPPGRLLEDLERKGVRFAAGQSIVEADAGDAPILLGAIRQLELPLALLFNRGRVMVLPQSVSKATGVRYALTILRLSPHNTLAIGDAENDHELLQACEVGVAVAWGSEALKAAADYVLPGEGPPAVAGFIDALGAGGRLPAPRRRRQRRLLLGHTDSGQPLALSVRGRNVLVAGDPKSGKSWVTGLLCEQLILYGYCLCIIDPEGDYVSLEALPGVAVFGGADPLPRPRELLRALRHPDVSVVVDLSHTPHEEKIEYLRSILPGLTRLRRHTGLPHRVVVDEAHYFLNEPDVLDLLDLELNGYTLVTYRASHLHPALRAASEAILVTRESDPEEVRALYQLCASCQGVTSEDEWLQLLGNLVIGEAVALPVTEEAEGELKRMRLAPRLTPHVRHLAKYIDIPVPDRRAFVFWHDGTPAAGRARTLREFVSGIEAARDELDGHLRRNDFSRWVAEVFGDYPLAIELRRLEERYRAGTLREAGAAVSQAVRSRYDFLDPVPGPGA